ncbi:T9SS type A sorting domain-containing protein [candidate division WOR-3 bacterium]|nr:T9SS type A sorting domain-containing protein [candidate division WOR-3 bacterium]
MNKFLILTLLLSSLLIGTLFAQQWGVVDSVSFTTRIPADGNCYIYCDYAEESLCVVKPVSGIIQIAQDAVDYAPDWLKEELEDNFSRLDSSYQDLYANRILDTDDPCVDEIAFCIAHLAPQTLTNSQFDPYVLLENAEYLYFNDMLLDYVTIDDSGSAAIGGNYFSTTRYFVCEDGDTVEYFMPRDIYYWFIVHPKLQEELPTYIDPVSGSPATPPMGEFWRNYLFNHSEPGYPALRDTMIGFKTLWNCKKDSLDYNGALGRLSRWCNTVLPWGSPHYPRLPQPVYLYHWHTGTCSEHGWFADGAARTVLIPATLSVAYRYNHKWNEFYERRWIQWETINGWIDMYPYDHWGGGDNIPGCFNWRGDGYIWTITERYTPVCTLKVHITDAVGNPVDGARIIIDSSGWPGPWTTAGWTTSSGDCQFLLGDSVSYFTATVQSVVGNISTTPVINNSQPNVTYYWNPALSGTIEQLKVKTDTLPTNPLDAYKFEYTIDVENEILYGQNPVDNTVFSDFISPGNVDFFICDSTDFAAYAAGDSFYSFMISEDASALNDSFVLPEAKDWYLVLSNEDQVVDKVVANVTVKLLKNLSGVEEEFVKRQFNSLQATPNPATSQVRLSYRLSKGGIVSLNTYDLQGRLVKEFINGEREKGIHSITWNTQYLPSGIYFVRFETSDYKKVEKVIIMR